jgi:hypothetical protein
MLTVRPRIFVDASAHIALARRDDEHHYRQTDKDYSLIDAISMP